MPAPRKYPLELRERAVRMYRTAEPKPVIRRMAEELGVHHEALRNWIRRAEADAGERDDRLTTDERAELAALRKENAQLKRANEVLRTASAFFAAQLDPTRPRRRGSLTSTHAWESSASCGLTLITWPRSAWLLSPNGTSTGVPSSCRGSSPALCTTMSRPPRATDARSTTSSAAPGPATSPASTATLRPNAVLRCSTCSRDPRRRLQRVARVSQGGCDGGRGHQPVLHPGPGQVAAKTNTVGCAFR